MARRRDPGSLTVVPTITARLLLSAAGSLLLGAVVGVVGTVTHRSTPPWGIALGLALVLAAGVTARAWGGLVALIAFAAGWCAVATGMSLEGPGGDVLVPGGTSTAYLGQIWLLGAWLPIAVTAFLPARWFRDAPRPPRIGTGVPVANGDGDDDAPGR